MAMSDEPTRPVTRSISTELSASEPWPWLWRKVTTLTRSPPKPEGMKLLAKKPT